MALTCLSSSHGAPVGSLNLISITKPNAIGWSSSSSTSRPGLHTSFLASSPCSSLFSFAGLSLRHCLNFSRMVVERSNLVKVRAGKAALGLTKRSRSRKSRARTHGFRLRMRTPAGRRVLKRRRAKGRRNLVTQTNPSSGKRA